MAEDEREAGRRQRPRHGLVLAIIILATILGIGAGLAVWVKRQALETDTWVETSTDLLADEDIQESVADFLVEAIFTNVDVEAELVKALPPQAQPLAGPLSGGLRELANRAALEALEQPKAQELWADANRLAHEKLIALIEDELPNLETGGGEVTLDLGTIAEQVGDRVGIDIAGKLPPEASQIVILEADQLSAAQDGLDIFKKVGWGLLVAWLLLYALAIVLARGWRREAVRAFGFSVFVIGVLLLVARSIGGDAIVDSLAKTAAVEPAVDSTWTIGTSQLGEMGGALIAYGIAIVLGAWLAGPSTLGRAVRRGLTPALRDRAVGYGLVAAIVLLFFVTEPTPAAHRLLPALILIGLLVAGYEALRALALRDFPDETWERASERWRRRFADRRS